MTVRSELLALQKKARDGVLRVEAVLTWAKSNKSSKLYREIEWNTAKAAREYQLWQIRRLIYVHVHTDEGEPELVSLSIDRVRPGGGYRSVDDVLTSKELSAAMLKDALDELERVRIKYGRVKELTSVWDLVDEVKRRATKPKRNGKERRAQA